MREHSMLRRLPAIALLAAVSGGALFGCAKPAPPEPAEQPYTYVNPGKLTGEVTTPEPPAFSRAEESLALALCRSLERPTELPSGILTDYEDQYTALKKQYKLNGPDELGGITLELVSRDYCPEEVGIFGNPG